MDRVCLATVKHTGTTYFRKGLQKNHLVKTWHCSPKQVRDIIADDFAWIATTYRDPMHVAASWLNRGELLTGQNKHDGDWFRGWEGYRDLLDYAETNHKVKLFNYSNGIKQNGIIFGDSPENAHPDTLGLHKALREGDLDYYYSRIPRYYTEYAYEQIKGKIWLM